MLKVLFCQGYTGLNSVQTDIPKLTLKTLIHVLLSILQNYVQHVNICISKSLNNLLKLQTAMQASMI